MIKRYTMLSDPAEMSEDETGEYVLWSDVEKIRVDIAKTASVMRREIKDAKRFNGRICDADAVDWLQQLRTIVKTFPEN
jgi:hypothetical protein